MTTDDQKAYNSGRECRIAGMSEHANPHRNTDHQDTSQYLEWLKGWRAQDEILACAELGMN